MRVRGIEVPKDAMDALDRQELEPLELHLVGRDQIVCGDFMTKFGNKVFRWYDAPSLTWTN